jgi:hypothetical protein
MKSIFTILLLLIGSFCLAQSGPFAPSGGSQSLTLNVAGGVAAISTTPTVILAKTVPLVANTTNYVYVDLSAGAITSNTSGFSTTDYPVATAITNAIQVITFQDVRPGAFNVTGSSGGAGTVTSVGQTVNGGASSGIFAVTGSPVTSSGTLNIGITGTSGGLPYFSSGTVLSSSGALPVGDFILGGGAGASPTATFSIIPSGNGGTGINNSATLTLGSSNQNWATLGTGIVKNTTTTGAITDAVSSDVISLWTGTCSSSTWLNGAGVCTTPSGGGGDTITSPNSTLSVGGSSTATTLDLAGSAGEIMAGATPALTYTPTLGKSGTAGTLSLFPATGNFVTTFGSAATASNTINFFASVPTNLHLFYCAVSSVTCTLTDAGYAYNAVPFANLTITAANIYGLWTGTCSSSTYLNGAGACTTPSGSGTVTSIATTSPITGGTITTTGTIACATCVTSAASLTSTAFMTGAGSQASQTPSATATLSSGGAPSFPGLGTFSAAGVASTPGLSITGAPYAAGSTTTNFPQLYVNAGSGPTTFSATGTEIGANSPSGFTGNFLDFHVNGGVSVASLNYLGVMQFGNPAAFTLGTGTAYIGAEGTAFTGQSGYDGTYPNSTNHCLDVINQTTDIGCVAALGAAAQTFTNGLTAPTFTSNVAIGTAPFTVTSTTNVPNLNASTLAGINLGTPTQYGIAYGVTATQIGTTAALTANALIKAGSSAAPSASSVLDDGKNITTSEVFVGGNKVFVTSDFTDSTSGSLQLITGLSYTLPTSKAVNVSFHCMLLYDQGSAAVVDEFGIGITGTAPTQANASATAYTSASATTTGTLTALASTTPTLVVSFTPSAITTIWKAELDGTVEQPSNATPGVFGVYAYTTTGTDNLIVKRGSYCEIF